jgi:hypothetical protein
MVNTKKQLRALVNKNRTKHQTSEEHDRMFSAEIANELVKGYFVADSNRPEGSTDLAKANIKEMGYTIRKANVSPGDRARCYGNHMTKGFRLLNNHPDFQIVLEMPTENLAFFFSYFYAEVKRGRVFEDEELVIISDSNFGIHITVKLYKLYINFAHYFRIILMSDSQLHLCEKCQLKYLPPIPGTVSTDRMGACNEAGKPEAE